MALIHNENGNYLRIDKEFFIQFLKNVRYKVYKDEQNRHNPDVWTSVRDESLHCDKFAEKCEQLADNSKSIIDNFVTAVYESLKTENVISLNYSDSL